LIAFENCSFELSGRLLDSASNCRTRWMVIHSQDGQDPAYRATLLYNCNMTSTDHQSNRIQVLDALRGFALAGILVINAMSILAVKGSTPAFTVDIPIADRILQDLILFLLSQSSLLYFRFSLALDSQFKYKVLRGKALHFAKNFTSNGRVVSFRRTSYIAFLGRRYLGHLRNHRNNLNSI